MLFRKQEAAHTSSAEEFAEAVMQASPNAYVLLRDADEYPLVVSEAFTRFTGITKERLCDDPEVVYQLLAPDDRLRVASLIGAWDGAEPLVFDAEVTPAGPPAAAPAARPLRCTLTKAAHATQTLATIADISAERAHLAQMAQRVSELEQESSVRADFLNTMSHEIRTPLNGIVGMVALARDHLGNAAELGEDFDKIDDLTAYLRQLINNILDMSRLESGKVELEHAPFSLAALLREVETMFLSTAAEKGVAFRVEKSLAHPNVLGDRLRLSQAVINIVGNALKFTDAGGSVTVDCREMYFKDGRGRYMISVSDTGKGIAADALGRIFRPFEQEDSSISRSYGGSGLGVSIADRLVSLMGGELVVDSVVGKGSTFVIRVPFEVTNREVKDGPQKPVSPNAVDWASLRMLLVEDNDINARVVLAMMSKLGARMDRASSGEEALERYAAAGPGGYDVVLMDVGLPGMDGWEATKAIRRLERDAGNAARAVIIALSANAYVEDKRHSIEVGMDDHLAKPLDFRQLGAVIASNIS